MPSSVSATAAVTTPLSFTTVRSDSGLTDALGMPSTVAAGGALVAA